MISWNVPRSLGKAPVVMASSHQYQTTLLLTFVSTFLDPGVFSSSVLGLCIELLLELLQ